MQEEPACVGTIHVIEYLAQPCGHAWTPGTRSDKHAHAHNQACTFAISGAHIYTHAGRHICKHQAYTFVPMQADAFANIRHTHLHTCRQTHLQTPGMHICTCRQTAQVPLCIAASLLTLPLGEGCFAQGARTASQLTLRSHSETACVITLSAAGC